MEFLTDFLEWVWARHHNVLSWYVRPLFIIPFCYFAYKRNLVGILLTLLILPTSLFWFPAPERPDPKVVEYLAWEREFVTGGDLAAKLVLILLVIAFFFALGAAFWKRRYWYGLAALNAGTLLKVVWSVAFGGERGWASLLPSVVTLVVCNGIIIAVMRWHSRRALRNQPV
jgi:hypothetical protein